MVKFTLDKMQLEVAPGTTVLNAARAQGIDIPTFCYQDRLSISASCRMCLVEIEGRGKLEPACATMVGEDMVVHSRSDKVVTTREDMLEILLANHPLDCPICDKGGECELQDMVFEYGKGASRLYDPKRVFRTRDIELNGVIVFNANRCIQCQRCVRMCEEVVGEVALGTAERGLDSEITGTGNSLKDCSHCGNCIEVCPVGALMSVPYRYQARPWDLVRTETICGMCGTGCSMTVETRDGDLMRVKSDFETGINGELLCAKGRFGIDAIDGGTRIREPMIRKAGTLTTVSWDEAIGFIAKTATDIRNDFGHIQGVISPRQTNETAFAFQKLMRQEFKSDDIHSSCRFSGLRATSGEAPGILTHLLRHRLSRKPLQTVLNADVVLVLGANVTAENPVTGYLIRTTLRDRKNQLFVASSRPCGLDDIARTSLRLLPGQEAHFLATLTSGDQALDDDDVAAFSAVAKPEIAAAGSVTLLVGTEFLRTTAAEICLTWIEQAARRLEAEGKTVFVQFLFDRPNQLGLWDMGCLPGAFSEWPGKDKTAPAKDAVPDMVYVLGADPVRCCPSGDPCETAAITTGCLVVQASHMNKTAEIATVVLPAASYGEEPGTFTNNEGRVQKVQKFRDPSRGHLPAIEVFERIAAAANGTHLVNSIDYVLSQIEKEIPGYGDIDKRVCAEAAGLTTSTPFFGDPAVIAASTPAPIRAPDDGYVLITGDSLFHSGSLSARSKTLSSLDDGAYVELNPGDMFDAENDGRDVTIISNGTTFTARLKVNRAFPEGVVFAPEYFLREQSFKQLSGCHYPWEVDVKL